MKYLSRHSCAFIIVGVPVKTVPPNLFPCVSLSFRVSMLILRWSYGSVPPSPWLFVVQHCPSSSLESWFPRRRITSSPGTGLHRGHQTPPPPPPPPPTLLPPWSDLIAKRGRQMASATFWQNVSKTIIFSHQPFWSRCSDWFRCSDWPLLKLWCDCIFQWSLKKTLWWRAVRGMYTFYVHFFMC